MGFELYQPRSGLRVPPKKIRLTKGGSCTLSSAVFAQLGNPARVLIFYDAERQMIAFRPADSGDYVGLSAHPHKGGAEVNLGGALSYYGLKVQADNYDPEPAATMDGLGGDTHAVAFGPLKTLTQFENVAKIARVATR